jgi:phosphatidylglycerophosphatase A
MSQPSASTPSTTTSSAVRKPRVSLAIATVFGLGYLPKAPGTFGSLGGVAISLGLHWWLTQKTLHNIEWQVEGNFWTLPTFPESMEYVVVVLVGLLGVYVADRAAKYVGKKDPQFVVIDEVSGQMLVYFSPFTVLNWKSWLLGFILFRVFDIWKPFPARQAESLPGGLGIMADDWIAGIYAALGLWAARALGL